MVPYNFMKAEGQTNTSVRWPLRLCADNKVSWVILLVQTMVSFWTRDQATPQKQDISPPECDGKTPSMCNKFLFFGSKGLLPIKP